MAFDAFLKIDGIIGESTDEKYKEWIEITSYSHGVTQPASSTVSSNGWAPDERGNFADPSIAKQVDKATPKLFGACCLGKHIKEVIIEFCRTGGDKQEFLEIRLEQVLISNYHQDAGGEFPTKTISFNPSKFKIVYSQQKREDGGVGGNVSRGWDLIQKKVAG